ncbi:hypothetical protein GOP47_0029324 [Adiantum capillus-veneris]|nr:hypothetical protein GOP47_0029324 [Adiantum capillus-veneris]
MALPASDADMVDTDKDDGSSHSLTLELRQLHAPPVDAGKLVDDDFIDNSKGASLLRHRTCTYERKSNEGANNTRSAGTSRGKIQIRPIENTTSSTGKLFEYSSSRGIRKILERYKRCSGFLQGGGSTITRDVEYWKHEAERLKERLIFMEETQRNMMGENLGGLQIKDLQTLESKLDTGLNKVRAVKTHLLAEQVQELRKKEQILLQQNEVLRSKLAEARSMQAPTSGVTTATTTSQEVQESSSARGSGHHEASWNAAETTLQLACAFSR